jgi:hypothetical protein
MESELGDGGEGALVLDGGFGEGSATVVPLAAGTHHFSSIDLTGNVQLQADGGTVLFVQGAVHLSHGATLGSDGALRIVAGGPVLLDCSTIQAAGALALHQPGDAGISLDCLPSVAQLQTLDRDAGQGSSGALEVWTRGQLRMDDEGYLQTGRVVDLDAGSGGITLRASDDIRFGDTDGGSSSAGNSYVIAGAHQLHGQSGGIDLASEGAFFLGDNSYLITGSPSGDDLGAGIVTRVRGGTTLSNNSYYIAGNNGDMEVVAEGELWLDLVSYLLSGHESVTRNQFVVKARSLRLTNQSELLGTNTGAGGATDIFVEVSDGVSMDGGSQIQAGPDTRPTACVPDGGGVVRVRAGGSVRLEDDQTEIYGGYGGACAGGDVSVVANGTIDADYPDGGPRIYGGSGTPDGRREITPQAGIAISPPDAGLVADFVVLSKPLAGSGVVVSCTAGSVLGDAQVTFSLDGGSEFIPAGTCAGLPLSPGWRYRIAMKRHIFDGASVDSITLQWR